MTGLYLHHAGDLYAVLAQASDSTNERARTPVVIYYSLRRKLLLVRTAAEFFEDVTWPDGQKRPRFVPVDPSGNLSPSPGFPET